MWKVEKIILLLQKGEQVPELVYLSVSPLDTLG